MIFSILVVMEPTSQERGKTISPHKTFDRIPTSGPNTTNNYSQAKFKENEEDSARST